MELNNIPDAFLRHEACYFRHRTSSAGISNVQGRKIGIYKYMKVWRFLQYSLLVQPVLLMGFVRRSRRCEAVVGSATKLITQATMWVASPPTQRTRRVTANCPWPVVTMGGPLGPGLRKILLRNILGMPEPQRDAIISPTI